MVTPTGIDNRVFEPTLAILAVAKTEGCCTFCIIDGLGNTVYSSQQLSNNSFIINKKLSAGIYLVLITEGDKLCYKKLIVTEN